MTKGEDRAITVGLQRDLDTGRTGCDVGSALRPVPSEAEHDSLVRDEFDEFSAHDAASTHLDDADTTRTGIELGRCAPPITHPLWVGPVSPHRFGMGVDVQRLLDDTPVGFGHVRFYSVD